MKNKNLFTMMLVSIVMFSTVSCTSNSSESASVSDSTSIDTNKVAPAIQKMYDTAKHNLDSVNTKNLHAIDSVQTVSKHRIDSSLTARKNLIKKNTSR